jgi:hypothetical protein
MPEFSVRRFSARDLRPTIFIFRITSSGNTEVFIRGLAERDRPKGGSFEHWGESPDKHYLTA